MRSASSGRVEFIATLRRDWQRFRSSHPGQRFCAYYREARRRRSTSERVLRVALGVVLCAGGVVLWFLPGPGWLLILFGMALFAGVSERLARWLDGLELALRERARRLLAWWRRRDHAHP